MSTVELPNALRFCPGQITGMQKLPEILARIDERLMELGLSDNAASVRAGKPDAIRNARRAINSPNRQGITLATLEALAGALETDVSWLADGRPRDESVVRQKTGYVAEPNAIMEGPTVRPPDMPALSRIPELGIGVASIDEDESAFQFNGQAVDHVARPPGLANRTDVFALRVANLSMWPKYRDGERIYVDTKRPAIEDFVVIELKSSIEGVPGNAYVKLLVARDSRKVTVEQFNPPGRLEFAQNEILRTFRVIPTEELWGG
jgi:phage repressor protein C with HTH and peptisase S24 domain